MSSELINDTDGIAHPRRPVKRWIDVTASLLGLLLLMPGMMILGILIRIADGSPVLFRQQRVGLGGKPFELLKFRTMRNDPTGDGPKVTVDGDRRVTTIGFWMRKTKVDEFPQLINILRGEMSLVGPRPEVQEYVDKYSLSQREVLELLPGITDPASLKYFDEQALLADQSDPLKYYVEHVMPDKIAINLDYAKHATNWSDLLLVLRTVGRIFRS